MRKYTVFLLSLAKMQTGFFTNRVFRFAELKASFLRINPILRSVCVCVWVSHYLNTSTCYVDKIENLSMCACLYFVLFAKYRSAIQIEKELDSIYPLLDSERFSTVAV